MATLFLFNFFFCLGEDVEVILDSFNPVFNDKSLNDETYYLMKENWQKTTFSFITIFMVVGGQLVDRVHLRKTFCVFVIVTCFIKLYLASVFVYINHILLP